MNAKILIVALCAFQLAAAASHKGITKQLQDVIRSRRVEVQTQATTTTQTVQNAARSATQNITLQIQAAMSSVQQYATNINSSSNQVQACLIQHAQQCAAIFSTSQAQIQQQVANQTSQIQAATQNFSAAVTNANSNVSQISSHFKSCLAAGVFSISNGLSCTATANIQVVSASNAMDAAFQSSTQILSQISASATGGDMTQQLNRTTYLAQTQLQQVSQQTTKCLQQAAASNTPRSNGDYPYPVPVLGPQ